MAIEDERKDRAQLLRFNEAAIAARALDARPEDVVLVLDASDEVGRTLAHAAMGKAETDRLVADSARRNEIPTLIVAVDRKRLARMTRARWPRLSERYSGLPPDGEVWVLVVAHGGATLASFPRRPGGGGAGLFLEPDGGGEG